MKLEVRRRLFTFESKRDACATVAFSADGRWLLCSSDAHDGALGTGVAIVDVASGNVVATSSSSSSSSPSLTGARPAAFSPDGSLIAVGTRECNVELFSFSSDANPSNAKLAHARTIGGFSDWLASLAFSPDGARIAAASKDEVRIVETKTGTDVGKVSGSAGKKKLFDGWMQALAWQRDALFASGSASPTAWKIDASPGTSAPELIATWVAKKKGYALSDFAIGNAMIAGVGHFGPSTLWDRETKAIVFQPAKDGRAVALSPDGAWMAHLDGKGILSLIETSTGGTASKLNLEWPSVDDAMFTCSLAFSPDGKTLACGHAWGVLDLAIG